MLRPRSQNSLGKKENKGKSQRHISEDEVGRGWWSSSKSRLASQSDLVWMLALPCSSPVTLLVNSLTLRRGNDNVSLQVVVRLGDMVHTKHFLVTLLYSILELQPKVEFLLCDKMCSGIDFTSTTPPISTLYSLLIFFFINSKALPMNIFWQSNVNDNKSLSNLFP